MNPLLFWDCFFFLIFSSSIVMFFYVKISKFVNDVSKRAIYGKPGTYGSRRNYYQCNV